MKAPENPNLSIQPRAYGGVEAETIRFTVPMHRPAPVADSVLTLECVRLAASSDPPGDPIVFLTGGPGISAIRQGEGRLFSRFDSLRRLGDVILLDQRGSGRSAPPEFEPGGLALPLDRALSRAEVLCAVTDATRATADRLRAHGVDLGAFNTSESADDVAELIRSLYGAGGAGGAGGAEAAEGAEVRVALLGWSYGTHLAMTIMRRHPSLVSRAVLAGPEGPDHTYKLPSRIQRQLEEVARMVRADAVLGPLVPDLVATLRRVFERVEKEPVRVHVAGARAEPVEMVIGRFDLEWMVAEGIADTRWLRRMPILFLRMERGDFSMLGSDDVTAGYLRALRFGLVESIVRPCMDCASGATAARRERIERETPQTLLGRTTDFPFPEVCEAVGSPDLGDDFRTPRRSDVPVLFITGTLDCRTPAENVADLAGFYPNHRHVVIEGAGHGDLLTPGVVQRVIERFLRDGAVDAERVSTDTPFTFERMGVSTQGE
jgi:pimeloyl-ACP methyl ester carboxylesterase